MIVLVRKDIEVAIRPGVAVPVSDSIKVRANDNGQTISASMRLRFS